MRKRPASHPPISPAKIPTVEITKLKLPLSAISIVTPAAATIWMRIKMVSPVKKAAITLKKVIQLFRAADPALAAAVAARLPRPAAVAIRQKPSAVAPVVSGRRGKGVGVRKS